MEASVRTGAVDGFKTKEKGLVIVRIESAKKDYFGALKGLAPFTKEDELKVHDE